LLSYKSQSDSHIAVHHPAIVLSRRLSEPTGYAQ
jgi:hypothetical protein